MGHPQSLACSGWITATKRARSLNLLRIPALLYLRWAISYSTHIVVDGSWSSGLTSSGLGWHVSVSFGSQFWLSFGPHFGYQIWSPKWVPIHIYEGGPHFGYQKRASKWGPADGQFLVPFAPVFGAKAVRECRLACQAEGFWQCARFLHKVSETKGKKPLLVKFHHMVVPAT